LLGMPANDDPLASLMADTVFLSPAAMEGLQLKAGDRLSLLNGTREVRLRVAGTLVRARAGQRLAVMDIGSAQWQFDRIGQLSRIDLKLVPGANTSIFRSQLEQAFGSSILLSEAGDQDRRTATMSRAYRVNLNVLALVALFTGAFLVFSTQALSVLRRRPQFALLRTLGVTRAQLLRQILVEGTLLGVAGSALGIALGYALAVAALSLFGGDLGGGYFPGVRPSVSFSPLAALLFFVAGTGVALLGSLSPALEAARAKPAAALKAGGEDLALAPLSTPWPALVAVALGAVFTQLPPVSGLPVFGYLAIVLLLVGSIALMPRTAARLFSALASRWRGTTGGLALARLANAPNQAAIALGGVLASFSLMVAMAIMVSSFRVSVDDWLQHLLSADLYVRVANGNEAGRLTPAEQQAVAALPSVVRTEQTRWLPLALDPARPSVTLIARSANVEQPERALPLVGESLKDVDAPIWVSEAMVDLYGWTPGQSVMLPLAGKQHAFTVAGVWRDYARQTGAIQMRLTDYRRITADLDVNDMSLWVANGSGLDALRAQLQALPFAAALEFAEPGEIRAISLKIFDRSFAITYLLEGVAILIGLFGVAATFSAQVLSRAKEFGMLRHVGVTRGQILTLLAGEGALLAGLAIVAGFVLGWCISLILVFIVNPQSFHWTMQLHMPWALMATVAAVLLVSASGTALVSGRMAVSGSAVRAVREDW
jgi:putative ABC transport system permease protein